MVAFAAFVMWLTAEDLRHLDVVVVMVERFIHPEPGCRYSDLRPIV
jgi:hypothetical protein